MSKKEYLHFMLSESQTIAVWFEIAENIDGAYVAYDESRKYNGFYIPADMADKVYSIFKWKSWLVYTVADEPIML